MLRSRADLDQKSARLFNLPKEHIMAREKHRVDDKHYRIVRDGGRRSDLYEKSTHIIGGDKRVEITDHHSDGTSTPYEADTHWLWERGATKK